MSLASDLSDRATRWLRKRNSYRACFLDKTGELTPPGQVVVRDLALFCDAYRTTVKVSPITGNVDPIASAVAQGRRDVWLRLQGNLDLRDKAVLQAMEIDQ